MRINLPLVALATGAFGIGVTEFAPMGMLPGIATDLGVSIPTAGLLVSAYAIGVLIGAPLMTLATVKIPRRYLLIGLMAIFTLGNLMAALASDYASLLVARVVTSLNHGAFFGIGSIVAASVVPPAKRAGAVAAMFMGLTLATLGGVPLATWLGEMLGWRTAFWGIAGLGLVAMTTLWYALPNVASPKGEGALAEIRVLGRRPVLAALLLTACGGGYGGPPAELNAPTTHMVLAAAGTARMVTVTNLGPEPAEALKASATGLPTGSWMRSTCPTQLMPGASCLAAWRHAARAVCARDARENKSAQHSQGLHWALMEDLSGGFVALPGGFGTYDELFEMLTWGQLSVHSKPIGLLNVDGFFDPLLAMIRHGVAEGFVAEGNLQLFVVAATIDELLAKMNAYRPAPVNKWLSHDRI